MGEELTERKTKEKERETETETGGVCGGGKDGAELSCLEVLLYDLPHPPHLLGLTGGALVAMTIAPLPVVCH